MSVAPQPDLSLLRSEVRSILGETAAIAAQKGWHLYLVGGVVRDLLYFSQNLASQNLESPNLARNILPQSPNFTDIDLVVDSYHQTLKAGTGVEVAQSLQKLHPEARLEIHGDFQTAAIVWDQDPIFGSLEIDLATARTESYAYPAANPQVETSSIYQDLYRRDFTINTLALRLTPNDSPVLDFFGGWQDLLNKQVRILHGDSFIDDPTRIYRAVRFAVRLGFALEPETETQVHRSISSGTYDRILRTHPKAPALQSRLKTEIKYLLQAPYSQAAIKLLGNLEAWKCLHPELEFDPQLWRQVRLLDRLLKLVQRRKLPQQDQGIQQQDQRNQDNLLKQHNLLNQPTQFPKSLSALVPNWLIRLELIIAALPFSERGGVARNLQLPNDSILRLETLGQAEAVLEAIEPELSGSVAKLAVSKVVEILRCYDISLLLLIAGRSSSIWRRYIWQYLTVWSEVRSPLDGKALQSLGYLPGKQYKVILEALLAATLDGLVTDQQNAVTFLENYFPLQNGLGINN